MPMKVSRCQSARGRMPVKVSKCQSVAERPKWPRACAAAGRPKVGRLSHARKVSKCKRITLFLTLYTYAYGRAYLPRQNHDGSEREKIRRGDARRRLHLREGAPQPHPRRPTACPTNTRPTNQPLLPACASTAAVSAVLFTRSDRPRAPAKPPVLPRRTNGLRGAADSSSAGSAAVWQRLCGDWLVRRGRVRSVSARHGRFEADSAESEDLARVPRPGAARGALL
jgi:hypothetical protein